jgi:hypothetical protein
MEFGADSPVIPELCDVVLNFRYPVPSDEKAAGDHIVFIAATGVPKEGYVR